MERVQVVRMCQKLLKVDEMGANVQNQKQKKMIEEFWNSSGIFQNYSRTIPDLANYF